MSTWTDKLHPSRRPLMPPEEVEQYTTQLREQVDRANADGAIIASLLEINRDLLMRNHVSHELFQTGDPGCPEQALDRNGEVVLGVCKNCGRVEAELDEHCDHRTLIKNLRAEIASLTSPKG